MENNSSMAKGLLKEGTFANKLINVLEASSYEVLSVYTGSSKRIKELNVYESIEGMKPFTDWFSYCITEENCLTTDELQMYNNLKVSGNLVPEEDLDVLINSFSIENPSELFLKDYESSLNLAKRELEALESLDNFLMKNEKQEEKKKQTSNFDAEAIIQNELENLEKLNNSMNEVLKNYAYAWEDLRKCFSHRREHLSFSQDSIVKVNSLKKIIDENLKYHLENDFKEVKPTEGKLNATAQEYWIIFNKFTQVREEIIRTVAKKEGLSQFKAKLEKMRTELPHSICMLMHDEIREGLLEQNQITKLQDALCVPLQEEVNCITSLKLHDQQNASKFLTNRLDRLNKLEHLLKQEKIYMHALFFLSKRNKVIQNYQLEKLNEFFKDTQLSFSKFQQRMDMMANFLPKRNEVYDSNFKSMMNLLNTNCLDLHSLDDEISKLHENIRKTNDFIDNEFYSLEVAIANRLRTVQKINHSLVDGPTREAFYQIFNNFLNPIESSFKALETLQNKIFNIRTELNEIKINPNLRHDCLWMKCLNNPDEFVQSIFHLETDLLRLREDNEILVSRMFSC